MQPLHQPAVLFNVAEEIRACICAAFSEFGTCGCPCRTCVVVGAPVFDDCCEGQLTVNLERIFIHDDFPSTHSGPIFCSSPIAAEYLITYVRCAPVIGDDGTAPNCGVLSEDALKLYTDLYIAERAIICCLVQAKRKRKFIMGDGTFIAPQGGCEGFEIRLTIEIEDTLSDL